MSSNQGRHPGKKISIYITSLIAIILWGMSYIWCDALIGLGIPVEYFIFIRILLAGVLLLCFNLVGRENIRMDFRRDFWWFLLLALCEPGIYFVCETYGIKLTESPTYSALIVATTPVFSSIIGVLVFKERLNLMNAAGIAVCLGALVMITLCSSCVGEHFVLGVILLMVAVFAEVGHASMVKVLSSRYTPSVIVMYQFLIGSALLLPFFLTKGLENFDPSVYLSWDVWKPILCLALLCSALAFTLWAGSIKHLGVAKSSVFLAMIPVVTAVAGFILGQELLTLQQWAGVGIFCIGLIMTQLRQCREKAPTSEE